MTETITIPLALAREVHNILLGLALSQRTEGLPARADAHRLRDELRGHIDARSAELQEQAR